MEETTETSKIKMRQNERSKMRETQPILSQASSKVIQEESEEPAGFPGMYASSYVSFAP